MEAVRLFRARRALNTIMPTTRSLLAATLLTLSTPALAASRDLPRCEQSGAVKLPDSLGDPKARDAAQRGLLFLSREAVTWQKTHNCYGCHVQGVTIEGLAVGKHNQYDIPKDDLKALLDFVTQPNEAGLAPGTFPKTGRAFAGASFARYDQYLDTRLRHDLLRVGRQLFSEQREDGAVVGDHPVMPPVATGDMQTTYQAMQTWRQCYARTADDVWLAPLRKAEQYVAATAKSWQGSPDKVALEDVNYALMALIAAGAGRSETTTAELIRYLVSQQRDDGGWAFGPVHPVGNGYMDYEHLDVTHTSTFATGQSVYALRLAGLSEHDTTVARGIHYLVAHQQKDGGWGSTGAAKAEAMWAVLGLVSVDVVTISVRGIVDGERVAPGAGVTVEAHDNSGQAGGVAQVALYVDNLLVGSACGPTFTHALGELSTGKHLVDAVAVNAKGQTSRRRLEFYAGDVFITSPAAQYGGQGQGTQLSVRDIGPKDQRGSLLFRVLAADTADGQPRAGALVYSMTQPGAQGAVSITWTGKGSDGKARPNGRYFVEVAYVDEHGKTLQTERSLFTHEAANQVARHYGEVSGRLSLDGDRASANTDVELVDDHGAVVQRATTNEDGQYRFKAVDKGSYKVRTMKKGFGPAREAPVASEPAHDARRDIRF